MRKTLSVMVSLGLSLLAACTPAQQTASPFNPTVWLAKSKLKPLLPEAVAWYRQIEQDYHDQGRPLNKIEQQIARQLGVKNPTQVRIVVLDEFPFPDKDSVLYKVGLKYGLVSSNIAGRTHGNTILLKPDYQDNARIIRHELVHTAQVDRMGHYNFLQQYFIEMATVGYDAAPLEQEARDKENLPHKAAML